MACLGTEIKKEFILDDDRTCLFYSSYGNCPRRVMDARLSLLQQIESCPEQWFLQSTRWDSWNDNLKVVADFVGSRPENLIFVSNATTGTNGVLNSFPLKAGDGILIYSWSYDAVKNTVYTVANKVGAEVYSVDISIPLHSQEDVLTKYEQCLKQHPNIKIAVIDLISCYGIMMPYVKLAQLCKKYGVAVMVDGAQGPGHIKLNLEELGEAGVDFLSGTLQKWCYTPRGCAILWVHPRYHDVIRPVLASIPTQGKNFRDHFFQQGTTDDSQFCVSKHALAFYNEIGGIDAVSTYICNLLDEAVQLLTEKWGTCKLPIPKDMESPFMRVVRLPELKRFPVPAAESACIFQFDLGGLFQELYDRFKIIALPECTNGEPWVRLGAQVFTTIEDFHKLADAICTLRDEEKK